MNEKELKISAKNARSAYRYTDGKGKELLESLFGKEVLISNDIRDDIQTFEDAIEVLGDHNQAVIDYYAITDVISAENLIALYQLRVIAEALNEGWRPKFNSQESRFHSWFRIYTKNEYEALSENTKKLCRIVNHSRIHRFPSDCFAFASEQGAATHSCVYSEAGLVFRTIDLANYCGTQFIDIWEKYLFA